MAVAQAAGDGGPSPAATGGLAERELNTAINHAIKETDKEIFDSAFGKEPSDEEGDRSLETMGDGLEGEDLVVENPAGETAPNGKQAAADQQPQADAPQPNGQEPSGDGEQRQGEQAGAQRDDNGRFVPRSRLDEELRRGRERESQWRDQFVAMQGQMSLLQQHVLGQQQQQRQPPVAQQVPEKPDMFAQPEAYEQWLLDRATENALGRFQQTRQQEHAQNVDQALSRAARSERGFEFTAAYNALTSLDPANPDHQALVRYVYTAPDPGRALFEIWDNTIGPQYREQILAQLTPRQEQQQRGGQQRSQQQSQQQMQPRHEYRPSGQPLPSLNGAQGSNVQRTADPEMLDGSDASVFDFAARR